MRIGELARRTGCSVDTIRYYEREGLLAAPERGQGNYRMYDTAQLERLTFVRNCRALEMSLGEIRRLLDLWDGGGPDCGEVVAVIAAHIGHVNERIARLRELADQLAALRDRCGGATPVARCGILRGLVAGRETAAPTATTDGGHLDGPHSGGTGRAPSKPTQ